MAEYACLLLQNLGYYSQVSETITPFERIDMRQNETERTIESRIAIETAGDSYWRESGSEIVSIHSITIREYDMDDEHYFDVYVRHDSEWTIYTDSGFERAISDAIGHEVRWSEQGMQEDGIAHLEA